MNSMLSLLAGGVALSILHALIPNHWLPVLAVGKKEQWGLGKITRVTFILGIAHVLSTVLIGLALALIGSELTRYVENFTSIIAPAILILLGIFYIYQHARHHHFHMHGHPEKDSGDKLIYSLAVAMLFSPCFEIEAYFLMAGAESWWWVGTLTLLYSTITILGMITWIRLAWSGLQRTNWHSLEHNSGIITGITLILSGIIAWFVG